MMYRVRCERRARAKGMATDVGRAWAWTVVGNGRGRREWATGVGADDGGDDGVDGGDGGWGWVARPDTFRDVCTTMGFEAT